MLEPGEWSVEGNEVVIKVSQSQTVVDMSLSARREAAGDCLSQRPFWGGPSN